jgi:ADP-ribosylglycohydrolase
MKVIHVKKSTDEINKNILLGLIVGDALGSAFDGLGRSHIHTHFKSIDNYVDPASALKGKLEKWKKPGFYSSISQFAIIAGASKMRDTGTKSFRQYIANSPEIDEYRFGIFRYPDSVEKRFIAVMKEHEPGIEISSQPSVRIIAASTPLSLRDYSLLEQVGAVISYIRHFTHDVSTAAGAASITSLLRYLASEQPASVNYVEVCRECIGLLIEAVDSDPGAIFKSALNPDALIRELHEMNEILSRLISIQNKSEAEAIICASMNKRLKSPITRATVNMPLAFIPYTLLISTIHRDDPGALFHASMEGGSAAALTALSAAVRSAVYGSAVIPEILVRNLANRKKIMAIVESLDNGSIPGALTDEFIQTEASLTRKELEELKAKQKHVKKKPKDKLSRTDKEGRLSHYVVESWTKIDKAKWKKEKKKMDKKTRA